MIRGGLLVCACAGLSACATLGGDLPFMGGRDAEPPAAPAQQSVEASAAPAASDPRARAAEAAARELSRIAREDPERLAAVEPELRALVGALARTAAPDREDDAPEASGAEEPGEPASDEASPPAHGVHLASYRRTEHAISGWATLQTMFPDILGSRDARIERVDLGESGVFLRLKAGPFETRAAAERVCAPLREAGAWCEPVDFTGEPLGALSAPQ